MPIPLYLSALSKVVSRLDDGLSRHLSSPQDLQLQDGLILRLKTTYELSLEILRRNVFMHSNYEDQYRRMTFENIICHAREQGLIKGDNQDWLVYRDMYLNAKQAYTETAAKQALKAIPRFLNEARNLLYTLLSRAKD